ncbi:MAG: GNAT family N-acetyltransferase [Pseudomonadota bacterium]
MTLPTLRTQRLTLQAPRLRDARLVAKALNNINVSRWLSAVPFPYGVTDAQWFINENLRGNFHAWFIWQDAALIGTIGLDGELGYWLAQDAWGQGFATEAARAVVDYHFEKHEADHLKSTYFDGNAASRSVLVKLGFERTSADLHFSAARQEDVPVHCMTLTRHRWEAARDV